MCQVSILNPTLPAKQNRDVYMCRIQDKAGEYDVEQENETYICKNIRNQNGKLVDTIIGIYKQKKIWLYPYKPL